MKPKKRGPRGGIQHRPGRGHDTKSGPWKKRRHQKKSAQRRREEEEEARRSWQRWDGLSDGQKKFLQELKPKTTRPRDED